MKETITVSDCCNVEAIQYEDCGTDDMGYCPECKDGCEYLDVCKECWTEGEDSCVCAENAEWLATAKSMKSLYDAEVKYGLHVSEGKKD